jgi:hypothetical protein
MNGRIRIFEKNLLTSDKKCTNQFGEENPPRQALATRSHSPEIPALRPNFATNREIDLAKNDEWSARRERPTTVKMFEFK